MSWTLYVHVVKGKTHAICVEPSHTIFSVKKAIKELTGVKVHLQKLLFNGRHLEDNENTLLSYNVPNWAKIILVPQAEPEREWSDLVIKTLSGKSIFVQAKLNDTVEVICTKIQKKEGMASEQQQLIYGGKVLDWDMPLDHYNIQHGSSLHVVCASSQRKVFFRTPTAPPGTKATGPVPSVVLLSDTVENVSKKVAKKFKYPPGQHELFFNGVRLEKGETLGHYSITSGSVIDIQAQGSAPSQEAVVPQDLFIRTPLGRMVSVEFLPTDSIKLIKEKVHAKVGLEPERQVLLLAGNPMDDNVTLGSCNISTESTFHLVLRPETEGHNLLQIFVKTITGKTFALDVNSSDSILAVKAKIEKQKGIPIKQQRLLSRGEPLEDSLKLSDYNIETESTFYLTLTSAPPPTEDSLRLLIETAEKTLELRVPHGNTVKGVKENIFATEKVPVNCQNLFFGGVELRDDATLSSCGVQDNNSLSLQVDGPVVTSIIYIRNLLGKTISVALSSSDKVKDLKAKVFAKEGIPVEQQKLIFQGTDLDDEEFVGHYNIEQESNLQLAMVTPGENARPSRIFIRATTATQGEWKEFAVEIPLRSEVGELKRKVCGIVGVLPSEQALFAGSQELLDDEATLESYDIAMHDFLQLEVRAREKVIFVKNLKRTITLGVSLKERVIDVKAMVDKKEGIHPSRQRLLFKGKELEDNRVIAEYDIDQRSTLVLSLKEVAGYNKIAVRMPSGVTFLADVYPDDTIASIKHSIQLFEHVPMARQNLLDGSGVLLHDEADATAVGDALCMELRPVTASVVVSKYDHQSNVRIIPVSNVVTMNDLQQQIEASLHVSRNRLKFFHNGMMLTNELSHLVEDDSVIMLDVTVPVGETLSGLFDGHCHLFHWRERRIRVKLPDNTSIFTFTIHEIPPSPERFKLPPSAEYCSQVYELSCTHDHSTNTNTPCTSADITIPYRRGQGSRLSFYIAERIPQWRCDLTPHYTLCDTESGTFDTDASYCVENFNCLICVCSKS